MFKNLNLILLFLSTFSLLSCVDKVDFSPHYERKVVVNCLLTYSNTQTLTLNYSRASKREPYEEVPQARVSLYENDVFVGTFEKKGYAVWEINHWPRPQRQYRIEIEIEGQPLISASTVFPQRPDIVRLKSIDTSGRRYFQKRDPNLFWAFAFGKPRDVRMKKVHIDPDYSICEDLSTNYPGTDSFNRSHIDENRKNQQKKHFVYIRMLPNDSFPTFYLEKLYSCVVVFRGVSPEYDRYLKSTFEKMLVYESFNDPTKWLDESRVYSNIHNGIGIFAAYFDLMFNCNLSMPD